MLRRRDFLAGAAGLAMQALTYPAHAGAQTAPIHDLLVRGGLVVDPAQGLHERRDIGIRAGKIATVAPTLDPASAREVIEADGRIVTPGFIDIHVHVYTGVSHYGVDADTYCVPRGVTTAVDAGTAGAYTFPGLRRWIIDVSLTRVRALLNISSIGMITDNRGELLDLEYADVGKALQTIEQHRDVILGIKVRIDRSRAGDHDITVVQRALEAGEASGLPIMVHIGNSASPLEDILALLRPGDLVTHSFHGRSEGILDDTGIVRAGTRTALDRGVLFDVGHGAGSFSFDIIEQAMRQGVLPSTISSNLHTYNINGPVYDQATTISKFLHLGLSLDEAVRRTTEAPAAALRFDAQIGTLREGAEADVAIFELHTGQFQFVDSYGGVRTGRQKLVPWRTVKGGRTVLPHG